MISLQGSQGERGDRGETGEGGEQVSNDDSFHLCHLSLLYERSIVFKYFGSRLVFFIKVFFTLRDGPKVRALASHSQGVASILTSFRPVPLKKFSFLFHNLQELSIKAKGGVKYCSPSLKGF